ncbi:unnamed protein product [Clonostachys rosea]|uniref:Zn(2)-C6 fungal-type domain-containing protein n=1 Tax=Bionectria ochroleuca TaxID=29856 RepID=A0ABY6V191_BIOOC|nr:unnamed protein product [Clonostachys rosea]
MSTFTALNGGSPKTSEPQSKVSDPVPVDESRPAGSGEQASRKSSFDRPRPQISTVTDAESSLKRKRSSSVENRRDGITQERTPDTATVPAHGDHRDSFSTPQKERSHESPGPRDNGSWRHQQSSEKSPYESHHVMASPPLRHMDDPRDSLGPSGHGDYPISSPEADDKSGSVYESQYTPDGHQSSILQHDPKKRKRNFSNRTKTGCMTCRKRKKKCDEQKPQCANCLRGGFECAGYPPQRGPGWQKPENKLPTVPLESKDPSYVPPGAYGMPQQGPYGNQPVKREHLPHYRGQALRIDPPQGRPLVSDDDRPTASTIPSASVASPDNKLSAIPYTPANAFPTPVSANPQPPSFADRMAKEYQRVPPLHDLRGSEPETPHPGNQLPQINILHATRTSSPAPPGQPQSSNAQVAAQLALSHSQYPHPHRRTQKEEMLSGRQFYPFDKELCLERERCATACWRFNNLTAPPSNGLSTSERIRLFLEILQPRDPVRMSLSEATPVTHVGRVGRNVAVETPFTCDYGYNITIGSHVSIGRNCTINDVCEVKIGDNCVIGPNVSIFTATLPIDPKRRQGAQGPQSGKGVTIEPDCWIAGGAMILAGKTIGKGSTVGAGSVVTKDVPPFTVVAGNPARVLRGVAT